MCGFLFEGLQAHLVYVTPFWRQKWRQKQYQTEHWIVGVQTTRSHIWHCLMMPCLAWTKLSNFIPVINYTASACNPSFHVYLFGQVSIKKLADLSYANLLSRNLDDSANKKRWPSRPKLAELYFWLFSIGRVVRRAHWIQRFDRIFKELLYAVFRFEKFLLLPEIYEKKTEKFLHH